MDDGELYEFAEDWGERTPSFVLTGFNDRKERLGLENKIQHLGVRCCTTSPGMTISPM